MIYFMGAFLCVYFYIAHIILIENEYNTNIYLLHLCLYFMIEISYCYVNRAYLYFLFSLTID
jgi:hypothetical protein